MTTTTATPATDPTKEYRVDLWTADPDSGEDACSTGFEFATEGEALTYFEAENPIDLLAVLCEAQVDALIAEGKATRRMTAVRFLTYFRDTTWLELDGPDIHRTRKLGEPKRQKVDMEWQNEIAMQAGMGGGCEAYNEAMGYY